MFAKVNTRYLHLMIRATHEPQNDNADPWTPAFDPANFKYCEHTLAVAKAARERRPGIELFATMLSPPPWMKTNNEERGKGKATLKPKLELEYAEYLWAFLAHMARNGCPVKYLAISNECDWDQPPFPRPPVRPIGSFRGLPHKANYKQPDRLANKPQPKEILAKRLGELRSRRMKTAVKSPESAVSRRGLGIFLTETPRTDTPTCPPKPRRRRKHLFRPLFPRNPHFPALRCGPLALSGASRTKQITSSY
jgi:hypothetical protein